MNYGPCMCGATDCPSCGPAQGYEVVRVWDGKRWTWVNPESSEEDSDSSESESDSGSGEENEDE